MREKIVSYTESEYYERVKVFSCREECNEERERERESSQVQWSGGVGSSFDSEAGLEGRKQ